MFELFRLIKNIFRFLVLIFLLGLAVICYARYIEPHMLKEKQVTVSSPFVTEEAENLKIVVFGDTHFSDYYTTDDFTKVIESVEKMEPDLIVFSGDLIDHYDIYAGDVDAYDGRRRLL